jgi:hypothetical protein
LFEVPPRTFRNCFLSNLVRYFFLVCLILSIGQTAIADVSEHARAKFIGFLEEGEFAKARDLVASWAASDRQSVISEIFKLNGSSEHREPGSLSGQFWGVLNENPQKAFEELGALVEDGDGKQAVREDVRGALGSNQGWATIGANFVALREMPPESRAVRNQLLRFLASTKNVHLRSGFGTTLLSEDEDLRAAAHSYFGNFIGDPFDKNMTPYARALGSHRPPAVREDAANFVENHLTLSKEPYEWTKQLVISADEDSNVGMWSRALRTLNVLYGDREITPAVRDAGLCSNLKLIAEKTVPTGAIAARNALFNLVLDSNERVFIPAFEAALHSPDRELRGRALDYFGKEGIDNAWETMAVFSKALAPTKPVELRRAAAKFLSEHIEPRTHWLEWLKAVMSSGPDQDPDVLKRQLAAMEIITKKHEPPEDLSLEMRAQISRFLEEASLRQDAASSRIVQNWKNGLLQASLVRMAKGPGEETAEVAWRQICRLPKAKKILEAPGSMPPADKAQRVAWLDANFPPENGQCGPQTEALNPTLPSSEPPPSPEH